MIDSDRWINTLPPTKKKPDQEDTKLDYDRWINTIPKNEKNKSFKKYYFATVLFISGLIFVSLIHLKLGPRDIKIRKNIKNGIINLL